MALVSIHNDSCDYINEDATGFKVAAAVSNSYPEKSNRLSSCMVQRYRTATGLKFHSNTITADMTSYHAFGEMDPDTTAIIIEAGFMNLDRTILTEHPEIIAQGIVNGILCYVRNEPIPEESIPTE
jgi:N-acetylmuramoyl-L-alanine amidase